MRSVTICPGVKELILGYQGENLAQQIAFDCNGWGNLYGAGVYELTVQPPNGGTPYPVTVTVSGNQVLWAVTDVDTATAGTGKAQLSYYVGAKLAKSQVWPTKILKSVGATGDAPDAYETWLSTLQGIAADVEDNAEDAADSADAAAQSAADAEAAALMATSGCFGVCNTTAATAAKEVTIDGLTEITSGLTIRVRFNYQNSAASPTLNLNSLGAYPIHRRGPTSAEPYEWGQGAVLELVFYGSYWVIVNSNHATTTYWGFTKLVDSTSDSSTDKAATANAVKTVMDAIPAAATATPAALGTAAVGTSTKYAREDHVHAKPTYTKSDVGLGNVDNVQQYSASNPPPYPVTSVNGSTGAVTLSIPTKTSDLTNDSGFITSSSVPTKTSDLTNDSGFTTHGIPSGGTTGQVLKKASGTDYDVEWGAGGGGSGDMLASVYDPANGAKQVAFDDSVVHLTGNETVAGEKTFTNTVTVDAQVYAMALYLSDATDPDDPGMNIEAEYDGVNDTSRAFFNAGSVQFCDYFDSGAGPITVTGIATPSSTYDAVNKGYVDTINSGKIDKPSSPATGAYLAWNGTAWVAQTLPVYNGGVT